MTQPPSLREATGSADARLAELLDELTARFQEDQPLDLDAYVRDHPEHAERLSQLLPALRMLADLSRSRDPSLLAGAASDPATALSLGELGDFRLVREAGRGGMGVVYEAEQISLRRRVALKVLSFAGALDSRQLRRFQNEAQAAAHLHHTHIVPVHYVGCERGVHFYAMQYVEGQSLAAVIAERRQLATGQASQDAPPASPLSLATVDPAAGQVISASAETATVRGEMSTARSAGDAAWFRTVAEMGVQAAEALDHAHQQGIVHRDIKPGNLMVDGRGHLWVTDFGLAQVQNDPRITMTGDLVGTLRYMSPEQALAKRVVVDHRTDVYSLGATLYELLTLEPAFPGADRQELLRQIAFEEPRPPRRLNKAIPKELETIVLKALEKNPADRYPTARELADDLRRFLEDRPIKAKPPSLAIHVSKWARRHRELVTASVALLLLAVLGLAASTILLAHANNQTDQQRRLAEDNLAKANQAAAKAEAINRFLVEDLLGQVSAENLQPDHKMTVEELLSQADKKIDQAFSSQREVEAAVRETLGRAYYSLTLAGKAEPHLRRAVDLYRATVGPEHEDTLRARLELADMLGCLLQKNKDAEALARPNLEVCQRVLGPEHRLTLKHQRLLTRFLVAQGKVAEVESLADQAVKTHLRVLGACHPDTIYMMLVASPDPSRSHRLAEAEVMARWAAEVGSRIDGLEVWQTTGAKHVLSLILQEQGRLTEAEPFMRQVVETRRRALGPANGHTAHATYHLARLLYRQSRPAEAEPLYREALKFYRLPGNNRRREAPAVLQELAWVLKELGKPVEADSLADEARQAVRDLKPADQARVGRAPSFPADKGRVPPEKCAAEFHQARQQFYGLLRETCPATAEEYRQLAWFMATAFDTELRDPQQAVELARKALEMDPIRQKCTYTLGVALYQAGEMNAALEALQKPSYTDAAKFFFLAMAQWRLGDTERARKSYDRAIEWMDKNGPRDEELPHFRAEAATLLGIHDGSAVRPDDSSR
jgi:serine/threonine protein kinase